MLVLAHALSAALLVQAPAASPPVPYVVVPSGRPWESKEFQALVLPFHRGTGANDASTTALSSERAGLKRLERGSVLLFHSPARTELATEIATLVERQHRLLYFFTRREFQTLSIAVIGAEELLPESFGFWVTLDGTSAWSLRTQEKTLPLRSTEGFWAKTGRSWLYHETLHECCHHGTCFDLRIMQHRWFCEGLSDYLAALAAVCYSDDADRAHVEAWIEPIEEVRRERMTVDVLADESWFAAGGGRANTKLETAAYGASQFVIAGFVKRHGHAWIRELLDSLAEEPATDRAAFLRRVEKHTHETQLAKRLAAVPLDEVVTYLKGGLEPVR